MHGAARAGGGGAAPGAPTCHLRLAQRHLRLAHQILILANIHLRLAHQILIFLWSFMVGKCLRASISLFGG